MRQRLSAFTAAYLLIVGGSLVALLPLLLYTSESPTVLGRYSPRLAVIVFSLSALFLLVSFIPIMLPQRIQRWLTRAISWSASHRFGLEIFGGLLLIFEIMLIVVAVFAWGASIRALSVIAGTLLMLLGVMMLTAKIAPPPAFQQMAKHLGLMLFGLTIGLITTELGLRMLYPTSAEIYATHPPSLKVESNPEPEIVPGISGAAMFTTQIDGQRGDPYDEANYNILAIGGSTTEQVYLDDSETWTDILQEGLGHTPSGQQVWVGNSGVSGHTSAHHAYVLRYLAPQYRLNTVIVLLGANDLSTYLLSEDGIIPDPNDPARHDTLLDITFWSTPDKIAKQNQKLHIVDIIRNLLAQVIPDPEPESVVQDPSAHWVVERRNWLHRETMTVPLPDLESGLDQYERNLRIMIREAQNQNVRLVFVTQPVMWRDNLPPEADALLWVGYVGEGKGHFDPADLRAAMDAFNARLLEVCQGENLECIDAAASMNGHVDYYYDDVHFNEKGAAELGRLLVEYFEQHPPFTP